MRNKIYTGVLLSLLMGCGSAQNEQGVSFSALGYMAVEEGEEGRQTCSLTTNASGYVLPLDSINDNGGGVISGCLLVQNNMSTQFVRTERFDFSYYIPGATEQPPSTSTPQTIVLQPVGSTTSGSTSTKSTLPPGFSSLGNRVSTGIFLVPAEIRTWLSLNRDKLPGTPFTMHVTTKVIGVTSAGDVLESNEAGIPVEVISGILINPGNNDDDNSDEGLNGESDEALSQLFDDDSTSRDGGDTNTSDETVTIIEP